MLQETDVWRIDACEAVLTCPNPGSNTVRESSIASGARRPRFKNRALDVHRHDDPLLSLSRLVWPAQPVFYIIIRETSLLID